MTHKVDVGQVRVSAILGGDIRLEASTYLREGYGLVRLAEQVPGRVSLGDLADIWQPSRLTGYEVAEGKGLPFLTAGQVFEDFPRVRKWLAKPFVPQVERRYVEPGWLLLSCSGVVGRVTAVYPHHLGKVITHDLLRIVPNDPADYGWLYAYMKTDFFQKVARAAQYGHMIKHIEVSHASAFPVIMPEEHVRHIVAEAALDAIDKRKDAWNKRDEAFSALESSLGISGVHLAAQNAKMVNVSQIIEMRSRFDASTYCGTVDAAERIINSGEVDNLGTVVDRVFLPGRFSRPFGEGGVPFVTPSDLFDVNARPAKRIYPKLVPNSQQYILHKGELLMVRSGQKYGLLGRAMMVNSNQDGLFGSDDPIHIVPNDSKMRGGYLLTFLNDPLIGRPYVVRNAYGTSVPHLDVDDITRLNIPRLGDEAENAIADLMDESVRLSAEADRLEDKATDMAQEQIDAAINRVSAS